MTISTEALAELDVSDTLQRIADTHKAVILAFNEKTAKSDAQSGPTKHELIKKVRESGQPNANGEYDSDAKKLSERIAKAQDALNKARTDAAAYGAELLGVTFEDAEEVSEEERAEARDARKKLLNVLKTMQDIGLDVNAYEVPNVGGASTTTFGADGVKRHRVNVTVTSPNGDVSKFESFTKLELEGKKAKSALPKFDVDALRKAYESNGEGETEVNAGDGWTVHIVKRES